MAVIGNKTGKLGEDIAAFYFKNKGFRIVEQNFWKPYGEIDLILEKAEKLHFVEVKVSRGTYNAAENVHSMKLKKLGRVIRAFLMRQRYREMNWQFDICVVQIDQATKKAKIKLLQNELLPE